MNTMSRMVFLVKEALENQILIGMLAHSYMKQGLSMKDAITKAQKFLEENSYLNLDLSKEDHQIMNEFGDLNVDLNVEFKVD